jgi:hypothetical protein
MALAAQVSARAFERTLFAAQLLTRLSRHVDDRIVVDRDFSASAASSR